MCKGFDRFACRNELLANLAKPAHLCCKVTNKPDFADVVELIDRQRLDGTFARFLHKSVRATFRKLVRSSKSE